MPHAIVKIDLCGSKAFLGARDKDDPQIRKSTLERLFQSSRSMFPDAIVSYPKGSFYKADGDALWFVLDKPTVALRAAIEFMQSWHALCAEGFPDCRVFLDYGHIESVELPAKLELVGKPFENISVFEKGLEEGRIYVSDGLIAHCDRTMSTFTFVGEFVPRSNEKLKLFNVNFLDPRTVKDSSLIHAVFVAHPQTSEARMRVLELLIVDCLLQSHQALTSDQILEWGRATNQPISQVTQIEKMIPTMSMVEAVPGKGKAAYQVRDAFKKDIAAAQEEFSTAKEACVQDVRQSIVSQFQSENAVQGVELPELIENYLCAVFSEIRMMANYFRDTYRLFETDTSTFKRFRWILRRSIADIDERLFNDWEVAFIRGLKQSSEANNLYIAAVFHNVLAAYYLNRTASASAYQVDKLTKRRIYVDTNVLYSLLVSASSYHEVVKDLANRFSKLGVQIYVYPFTIEEYETSLRGVVSQFKSGTPSARLIDWNPWLYQEYCLNHGRYLDSIEVCRQQHSICKDIPLTPPNYSRIAEKLQAIGLVLDTDFKEYPQETVNDLWIELRNTMASGRWTLDQYWDFIHEQANVSDEVIRHDVSCVANLVEAAKQFPADELGPRVLFMTLDSRKLLKLRKKREYQFILSVEQALEFVLPYLFLADVPLVDAGIFPNQLLSARLATLLVKRPPTMTEIARSYFQSPGQSHEDIKRDKLGAGTIERTLSLQRFEEIAASARLMDEPDRETTAKQVAHVIEQLDIAQKQQAFRMRNLQPELERLGTQNTELTQKIQKLNKTLKYWKQQAARQRKK